MPKTDKISADAAITAQPTIEFGEARYFASSNWPESCDYSTMSNQSSTSVAVSTTATSVKTTSGAQGGIYICAALPVTLSITVPAYTAYIIDYETYFNIEVHNAGMQARFDDSWQDTPFTSYSLYNIRPLNQTGSGWSGYHHWNFLLSKVGNYEGSGLVLYNDTASPVTMKRYAFYSTHADINAGINIDFEFTSFTVTAVKIGTPTTTDTTSKTYDGTAKAFDFTYDTPTITDYNKNITYSTAYKNIETTVEAKDFKGNTIASSNYSLSAEEINRTLTATEAGTYKVKFNLTAEAVANGVEWGGGGTGEKTLTFEIKRKAIPVPIIQNSTQTYKGAEYDNFTLLNYNGSLMSVSTAGNSSTITWDNSTVGAERFKATDAATYTVKFHMDSENHIWSTDGGESTADQSKTITINKKEITINTTPQTTNPSWDLGATGSITVNSTASPILNPDFVLNIYYVKGKDTANPLNEGIDTATNTLDVSQITSSGDYTLCVELKSGVPANENYSIANDKFEMPFTIGSGAIDFSVINWQYKEGSGTATDLFKGGVQEVLRYKQVVDGIVKYFITATVPAGGYLNIDTGYNGNGYTDGFLTTNSDGATVQYADAVGTYKTRIALNTDKDHKFKNDTNCGILDGNELKGWYEIEWKISKGKIDQNYLDNLNQNLQYKLAGGSWQTYDPGNPPSYGNGAVEIRLNPLKFPNGVSSANITLNNKNTNIGTYTAQVTFTTDTTNYEPLTTQTFQWKIAAKKIEVDWKPTFWADSNGDNVLDGHGVPYQIKELNISDDLKQYVEYHYYVANTTDITDFSKATFVGKDNAGLEILKDAPYNASSNNPVYVYVKAVLKSSVTQYELKDNSGNDCATLFQLGDTKTLAKVMQTETEMVYGGDKFNESIFSIIDEDTNASIGSNFLEGIYVFDSQNNALGLLSSFDGTTANVGEYVLKIVLSAAGEETYTLAPGANYSFTIKPKVIALPTVDEIIFGNNFVDLAEHLHGSYDEYKDIITLGGDVNGIKFAGTYHATLTITNPNYCWDYGADASATKGLAKYDLARDWTGDETVAETDWSIKPYVLKTSGWNLKGKDGAVYAIPSELIENLDVALQLWYFTDKAGEHLGEEDVLKAGATYFVKAELLGADANNFVFEDSNATVSDFVTYKIQPNGAAAFVNNVKDFVTKTWLGLPIWAWLAIGLAVLILLIIIIAVACKRRKSKEQRAEEKARKEEEKQRREEERRLQQERIEAERELARAKQEAELEKIRAQANMANAGMAATAMQQSMPAPVQADNGAMQKLEAELAEMRLRLASVQQPAQLPAAQQLPSYQQSVQPALPSGGSLEEIKMQIALIRAEQQANKELAAMKTELEMARLAAQQGYGRYDGRQPSAQPANVNAELLGDALISAFTKLMGQRTVIPDQHALPDTVEENVSQPVLTQYPSDAVITTTTTVDTTQKPQTRRGERGREDFSDVDGFYDNIDY